MSGIMALWLLFAVFFVVGARRRRRRRWGNDPRFDAWRGGPPWANRPPAELDARERDGYVDQLETRVARLEERLDFTEKLLMERGREGERIE